MYIKKMFSILLFFAYLISFGFTLENESIIERNDILMDTLHSAALQVISLHTNSYVDEMDKEISFEPSKSSEDGKPRSKRSFEQLLNVPHLNTSANFMHSYVSDTGAGNREDLLIRRIQEERLQVNVPSVIRGWNYVRFNSTDFVMGYQDYQLDVWRTHLTRDIEQRGLNFDHMNAYCSIDLKSEGKIMNAMFFTKLIKYIEVLFFTVTIESPKGFQLKAYEVTYGECVPHMQLNLRNNRPLRIGFVSSQYQSALVVLFNSNERTTQLKYTQKSHDQYTKVIEVFVKDAIDMETYTINGFGYIAVANRFGCEVYRLSEFIEHHSQFDNIIISGIIDIKAFRLGFNHFLGLATVTDSQYLYVWHSGSFYLKQIINVGSVIKWNTIYMPTCRDDVLLYFLRSNPSHSTQIYRWNGQLRDFQLAVDDVNKRISQNYRVMPYSLSEFSYNRTAYLLQVDSDGRSHLVSFHTQFVIVPDPEILRGLRITELMHKLKDRFLFQQTYLQKISDSLKFAVKPKSNSILRTAYLIRNIEALNGVTVNHVKHFEDIVWQNSPLTVNDMKYRIKDLENTIHNINEHLGKVNDMTNDVVLRNKPQIIIGHKQFIGHNEISSLNSSSTLIGSVGQQDLSQLLSGLYRISRPQVVKGVKHLVKPIYVKGSIDTNYTNGIDLNKQIVVSNRAQLITGHISYNSQLTITNDLILNGKFNDIYLDKEIVFINKPDVVFASKVFTSPIIIAQNVNALTIDGIDLKHLVNNVLLTSGSQTMNSKLTLLKPMTANTIRVQGMVNGIDISTMADQIVYKNRPVLVKGQKTFILDDVDIKNNLIVANKLDNQAIPNDFFINTRDQVISGHKVLKGFTRFDGKINVIGLVDGLRLPQDIVTLTKNDTILGPIVYGQSLIANKNIEVHGFVDGVDLSELNIHSLKLSDKVIRSDVRFKSGVTIGALDLKGNVNGINLEYLNREAIFKGSPIVEIRGAKHFKAHVDVEELAIERINGINISDFVTTNKNETIYSKKHFAGFTSFDKINVKGLIDGINIEDLNNNRVSLSKPQRITGVKNFLQEITISEGFNVMKRINDIIPQRDIVTKSKFQRINGLKVFRQNLNLQNLKARNPLLVRGKVDNILINDLDSRVVRLNAHKSFLIDVVLTNCSATITEVDKNINGINITSFANNVMSLSKPQRVLSPKTLKNNQFFWQIKSAKGLNGISISGLNKNAVHLNGISQIRAPFTFAEHILLEKPLALYGVINGVNLSYVANDAVYKRGTNLIIGQNVFKSGFRVNGNINSIHFNGVDLSKELLTNNRDHIIPGKVVFTKSLNISNNIELSGKVNGIDISEFHKKVMKTSTKNLIVGNLELTGLTKVLSNLNIVGKLNGINLKHFFDDALFLNGNQEVVGVKTIKAPLRLLNNLRTSTINNINIPLFLNEIVLINSPFQQIINSPKVFTNDLTSNGFVQTNGIVDIKSINSVDLIKLNAEAIKINKPIVLFGNQHFKDIALINHNITQIFGRLNGIDLQKDVILLHSNNREPQLIFGSKTFEHLVLNENVVTNGLVNGLYLKSIHSNTFYTNGNQRVNTHKIIKGLAQFYIGNNSIENLNGIKVEDLITLKDNQTIFAELIFNEPLIARNLMVSGYVSGENLTKLVTDSLVKDMAQTLSQPIKFDAMVFTQDVKVDEHVDNVDLSALSHTVKQFTKVVNISKDLMTLSASRHKHVSDYIYQSLEKSVFEIDGFVLYQPLEEVYGNHIELYENEIFSVSAPTGVTSTIHTIVFNAKTKMFDSQMVIKNSEYVDHKPFQMSGENYVIHMSSITSHNISSQITQMGHLVGSLGFQVSSIEIVKINENRVLLISLHANGKLNVYSLETHPQNHKNAFKHITEFNVGSETSKVIAFQKDSDIYIVVAKNYHMNCMGTNTGSLIYVLRNYNSLELVQQFPLLNVADVVHFENDGKHYLALSDVTPAEESRSAQTIYVYRNDQSYEHCKFSLFQKLEFDNVIQLETFSFGTIHSKEQYMAAANRSHIIIWKQEGESGFNTNWLLHTKDTQAFAPILASDQLFIIVGQTYKCHESLIFKADTRGTALAPLIFESKLKSYN